MLELAVLGLLNESPMHGYELNKRLKGILGPFRATFYGSLYPCLNALQSAGYIATDDSAVEVPGRRKKTTYKLTAEGKERLQEQLAEGGPAAWEDESFGVRFAFFAQTDAETRLRILEGRRSRLEERRQQHATTSLSAARDRIDRYTLELQRHGLESVEREVRWLNELIATERAGVTARPARARRTTTP